MVTTLYQLPIWIPFLEKATPQNFPVEKVIQFVLPYFHACSSLFFFGYATKELCWDISQKKESALTQRIEECRQTRLPFTQLLKPRDYSLAHGLFFIGTGACSAFEALHKFALINLTEFYHAVTLTGTGCFLFANILSLQQNIFAYMEAAQLPDEATEQDKRQAFLTMKSAILGILSNLGYVTMTAVALLGASAAIALVIGCISACFGGLKILNDFYSLYLIHSHQIP